MTIEGVKRKLTAIPSADVEGCSRLMGENEVATVRTLTAHQEVMASTIEQYRSRVVDSPGDNLLAEFASVVDAVQCAAEIPMCMTTSIQASMSPMTMTIQLMRLKYAITLIVAYLLLYL